MKTKVDYLVHLQKLPDPEGVAASAELAALLTDSGHLTPVFSSGTFDYTATVTEGNVKVMPIPLSKSVNLLEVNGKKCEPMQYSQQIEVKNGAISSQCLTVLRLFLRLISVPDTHRWHGIQDHCRGAVREQSVRPEIQCQFNIPVKIHRTGKMKILPVK